MKEILEDLQNEINDLDQNVIQSFTVLEKVDLDNYKGCSKVAEVEVNICGKPAWGTTYKQPKIKFIG